MMSPEHGIVLAQRHAEHGAHAAQIDHGSASRIAGSVGLARRLISAM